MTKLLFHILLTCSIIGLAAPVYGQAYEITPSRFQSVKMGPSDIQEIYVYIRNTGNEPLTINWKKLSNTLNPKWDYSVCDYGTCYISIPDSAKTLPIEPGDSGFLKLIVMPMGNPGSGHLEFYIQADGGPMNGDTLRWEIEVTNTTGIAENETGFSWKVFPNPSQNTLFFEMAQQNIAKKVQVLSLAGADVMTLYPNSSTAAVDISALRPGTYILVITDSHNMQGVKLFSKQ